MMRSSALALLLASCCVNDSPVEAFQAPRRSSAAPAVTNNKQHQAVAVGDVSSTLPLPNTQQDDTESNTKTGAMMDLKGVALSVSDRLFQVEQTKTKQVHSLTLQSISSINRSLILHRVSRDRLFRGTWTTFLPPLKFVTSFPRIALLQKRKNHWDTYRYPSSERPSARLRALACCPFLILRIPLHGPFGQLIRPLLEQLPWVCGFWHTNVDMVPFQPTKHFKTLWVISFIRSCWCHTIPGNDPMPFITNIPTM